MIEHLKVTLRRFLFYLRSAGKYFSSVVIRNQIRQEHRFFFNLLARADIRTVSSTMIFQFELKCVFFCKSVHDKIILMLF